VTAVVLVRPWTDARAGGGCCAGDVQGIVLDRPTTPAPHHHRDDDPAGGAAPRDLVAEVYLGLTTALPEVDVQVVDAGNLAYLLPVAFRAARPRLGLAGAVAAATRATTAGALLVDGRRVGRIDELGVQGVLDVVRAHVTGSGKAGYLGKT
jgi:hypothetical protein